MRKFCIGCTAALAVVLAGFIASAIADPSYVTAYQFPELVREINANVVDALNTEGGLYASSVTTAEIKDATIAAADVSIAGLAGAAALTATTGVTTAANYIGAVHYDVITFTSVTETFTDGSDEGESQLICTFPAGRILILGAAIDATVTAATNCFEATANDVFYTGIGTAAAADDATLATTEQDVIAVTTHDTASGGTLTFAWEADMTAGGDSVFDGTATAAALYFNTCVANTSISNNCAVTVTGTIGITWTWLGDD